MPLRLVLSCWVLMPERLALWAWALSSLPAKKDGALALAMADGLPRGGDNSSHIRVGAISAIALEKCEIAFLELDGHATLGIYSGIEQTPAPIGCQLALAFPVCQELVDVNLAYGPKWYFGPSLE